MLLCFKFGAGEFVGLVPQEEASPPLEQREVDVGSEHPEFDGEIARLVAISVIPIARPSSFHSRGRDRDSSTCPSVVVAIRIPIPVVRPSRIVVIITISFVSVFPCPYRYPGRHIFRTDLCANPSCVKR